MANTIQKSFLPSSKDVRYINRDFSQLKESLLNLAKVYYPNSYNDFSEASPGMMFIDMAAWVGDVLSYYTDQAYKESILDYASDRRNIISLARYLGYRPKPSRASTTVVDLYQLIPAKVGTSGDYMPDYKYALSIREGMVVSNNNGSTYILDEPVNFSVDSLVSPMEYSVYSRDSAGIPQFFLLKKTAKVSAGKFSVKTFSVGNPQPFLKLYLDDTDVLYIDSVVDSDNNKWYQVDYLAQELVPISIPNEPAYENDLSDYKDSVPYILSYTRTARRFTLNVDANNLSYLQFGSGDQSFEDEVVNLSSQDIGVGLTNIHKFNVPYDPNNFLCNQTYGISPSKTTLTVRYVSGGGLNSNCPSNDIRNVVSVEYDNSTIGLTGDEISLLNLVKSSLKVNNPLPAVGGKDAESDDEIRENATSFFASQNRAVSAEDYLVRVYSMPPRYGVISKAFVSANSSLTVNIKPILQGSVDSDNVANITDTAFGLRKISYDLSNPLAINLYVLSYDSNKNLTPVNPALTANLIKYMKSYKMLTDGINIIDGYVVNIGVDFSIITYKGFNKKEVLVNCLQSVKDFFNIDNMQFQQPINTSRLQLEIAKVEGVQSVVSVDIKNLTAKDGDYSSVEYDIKSATKNGIIYPSLDPSVFEVKYPDRDIRASTV